MDRCALTENKDNISKNGGNEQRRYYLAELLSLGIPSTRTNDLNDEFELAELAENIRQAMFHDYKLAYSEKGEIHQMEAESTIRL